jgi:hypothetical protein
MMAAEGATRDAPAEGIALAAEGERSSAQTPRSALGAVETRGERRLTAVSARWVAMLVARRSLGAGVEVGAEILTEREMTVVRRCWRLEELC